MCWCRPGCCPARCLVNIAGLAELKEIFDVEGGLSIGSGVCFTDLVKHPLIQQRYRYWLPPVKTVGSLQLRNRATIGGNIVNAAPCADPCRRSLSTMRK
jgi:CO/xanthine dehydrogenase FAD-binding subunit